MQAEEIGLKKGDQILEVNGQSFEHSTKYSRAIETLKSVCHLSITVKSNLLAFQDMLQNIEDGGSNSKTGKSRKSHNNNNHLLIESSVDCSGGGGGATEPFNNKREVIPSSSSSAPQINKNKKESLGIGMVGPGASGKFLAMSSRQLLNRAFHKFLNKPKSLNGHDPTLIDDVSLAGGSTCNSSAALFPVNHITNTGDSKDSYNEDNRSEYPEHVLKVFKADQTCKYLLIHKETTAHEVVMLSLQVGFITHIFITSTNHNFYIYARSLGWDLLGWWVSSSYNAVKNSLGHFRDHKVGTTIIPCSPEHYCSFR